MQFDTQNEEEHIEAHANYQHVNKYDEYDWVYLDTPNYSKDADYDSNPYISNAKSHDCFLLSRECTCMCEGQINLEIGLKYASEHGDRDEDQ